MQLRPSPTIRFGVNVRNLVPIQQDVASSAFETQIKDYLKRNGLDVAFPHHTLAIESYHNSTDDNSAYYTLRLHDRKRPDTVIIPLDYGVTTPAGVDSDFDAMSDLVAERNTPPFATLRSYILEAAQGRLDILK